jgi:hypothetical protein
VEKSERLKPFAEAIGEMCNEWAQLEQWIGRLFLAIGGWDYRLRNALVMIGCFDIRDQIQAAKIGAINRCSNGVFLDTIINCLDYIDNDLRTARNRFVHDIWGPADDGVGAIKVNVIPKATKVDGIREIQPSENSYVSIEEVREVTQDIIHERDHLTDILKCFQDPGIDPAQLLKPPQRLHLLRQREKQRQRDKRGAKQKHQRRSSRRKSRQPKAPP